MRAFFGSLLFRTLSIVVLALVLSQGAAMYLLNEYVTRPRMETAIGQFVLHLKTTVAALETMGPMQQNNFIARVAEHEGIRIIPVRGAEPLRVAPDLPQLRLFRERLRDNFGPGTEVYVRGSEGRNAPEFRPRRGFQPNNPDGTRRGPQPPGPDPNKQPMPEAGQGQPGGPAPDQNQRQFPGAETGPRAEVPLRPGNEGGIRPGGEGNRRPGVEGLPRPETIEPRQRVGPDEGRPRVLWVRLPAREREFWIAIPRTRIERDTASAYIAWAASGLVIAILATFFLVWRLNRPLGELSRAAVALGRGRDPPPISETGPTEIRDVARAFNQMKDDLKKNERERATFLAGISHDLRTPLTRLRLDVEMLEDKVDGAVRNGMISDVNDMNAIIDQFIDFTRSESAEPLSPVNLAELARSSAERAVRSGATVRCEIDEVPVLALRPLAMQRMVDNLLGNAAKHAGGEILLRTRQLGDRVEVAVLDRGPGIAPDMVDRLKQPFTRMDAARSGISGAGLGLAIANRIATLHGGTLELLQREGGGLEARVSFPAVS